MTALAPYECTQMVHLGCRMITCELPSIARSFECLFGRTESLETINTHQAFHFVYQIENVYMRVGFFLLFFPLLLMADS